MGGSPTLNIRFIRKKGSRQRPQHSLSPFYDWTALLLNSSLMQMVIWCYSDGPNHLLYARMQKSNDPIFSFFPQTSCYCCAKMQWRHNCFSSSHSALKSDKSGILKGRPTNNGRQKTTLFEFFEEMFQKWLAESEENVFQEIIFLSFFIALWQVAPWQKKWQGQIIWPDLDKYF